MDNSLFADDSRPTKQDYRKQLWIAVAAAVAASENCSDSDVPGTWANEALAAFDEQFRND